MLLPRPQSGLRKLRRYRQILTKVAAYGFAWVVDSLGLSRRSILVGSVRRLGRRNLRQLSPGERLRLLFEELGTSFIKLGQILSLRSDILPEEVARELARLQYGAAPLSFERLEPLLNQEFDGSWRDRFRSIDPEPVASASIAQVHRGATLDGEEVAVKIRRPGIEQQIRVDLAIMRDFASLIERALPRLRIYRPVQMVDQFARVITLELDLAYEGRTMELFRRNFRDERTVHIPAVHWELTTERVLTMEYVEGVRIGQLPRDSREPDAGTAADNTVRFILTQVFRDGVYNADPHPGNFIVRPDGVIAPVDFGMVGILDEEEKLALVRMLLAFVERDADKIVRVFHSFDTIEPWVRESELRQDLLRMINYYHHITLSRVSVARMLSDLHAIIRRYQITLPADLALTLKVIVTAEGLARRLNPEFDILDLAEPFVRRVRLQRLSSWLEGGKAIDLLDEVGQLIHTLPRETGEILRKARQGNLKIKMEVTGLTDSIRDVDRSFNRLAFAVVIAGISVGSSLLMTAGAGPRLLGLPAVGLGGYLIASVLGVWFLIGIMRSGRL